MGRRAAPVIEARARRAPEGRPFKVLLCHNFYSQPGGEDASFADEMRLLQAHGHEVVSYTRHSGAIERAEHLDVARQTVYNRTSYRELRALIERERPAVLHCTNTFPLLSPSVIDAGRDAGVPVVQALRNYRLICPSAVLFRDGAVCEDCVGRRVAWPGVAHACYRGSRAASAVVATMLTVHGARGTYAGVDRFYAPSEFARAKFAAGGLPADRIDVKPNFVDPDPGPGTGRGGYAIFVGRHAPEKGIDTLLEAWRRLSEPIELKVVGDGPLADDVLRASIEDPRIQWLGRRSIPEILELVGEAAVLVMPSRWYETFGRTIIEAFAKATPVVVSGLGAMAELVDHGATGLHFRPGDAEDLAHSVQRLFEDRALRARMRQAARRAYLERYTAEPNYRTLRAIYERAGARAGAP